MSAFWRTTFLFSFSFSFPISFIYFINFHQLLSGHWIYFLSDVLYQEDLHAKLLLRLLSQLCVFISSFPFYYLVLFFTLMLPSLFPTQFSSPSLSPPPHYGFSLCFVCFQLPHDCNNLKAKSRESRMWRKSKWRL